MNDSKFSDFGLEVRIRLLQMGKTQKWLQEEVREKTGLFVDGSYLNKILTGERETPKLVNAIKEVVGMKD